MRLKSLEIQGFKTFPDKTKLFFEQGITAVVGPNGSGKSNISDAIRWVLGEQSPKSLRCSKMEDVVFNGTDKRKKLGYAEVSLNIENKDRVLAFDGDEVSITRRYYRSGESEYLINKAQVRLKDINELFMDTGLGRDGYSMIGQGKIDSIVSSKGEDRREIFEEAAGISRYRYRKTDAERKLKSTEENLLRLRDIVTELEERVGPLKRQSEKAQEFLKYSEEKRGLEIALWLLTLDKSQAALKTQDEKIAIAHAQYDDAEKMLEQIQKESEEIYLKNGQLAVKSDEVRHLISELDALISDMRSQLSVSKNDILHNEENIKRIENEIQNAQQNSQLISTQIAEKNEKIAELDAKIIEKQKEYTALSEKLNVINLDTGKSGDKLQQLTSELSMLTTKSADARVIDMTAESSISDLEERIESLTTANKDGIARVHELEEISEEYTTNLTNLREEITSITNSIQGLELKLQSKAHKRDSYKAESDRLLLDSKEHIRKINFLENLERNLEGFSKSVKVVVNASKSGRLKGVCGPVSRVISVPQKYGVAIETALGAAMQNIVTETESDAKSAIAYLKSSDGGRATFLPLNTIKARELRENGLEANYGFIGVASDLCSCDNKFKNILSSLLGKIVIADNLNSAVEIAKKYSYRFKIVTLDGQVVNAGGSLTGGSLNRNTGLLSRASEIKDLKEQTKAIEEKSAQAQRLCSEAAQDYAAVEAELLGTRADLSNKKQSLARMEAESRACENELSNSKLALQNFDKQIEEYTNKVNILSQDRKNAGEQLAQLNRRISEAEEKVNSITGSRAKMIEEREEIASQLQNVRLEIVTAQKDIDALNSEILFAENSSNNFGEKQRELNAQIEDYKNKNALIQKNIDELEAQIKDKSERIAEHNARISSINCEKDTYEMRSVEYELTKREAEEQAIEIPDSNAAQKRLNELKQKIKNLGNVNVSAIEEYKEVSERFEFMSTQVNDVEKSKREIERLITDLTKQMKEVFVESFEEINKNFTFTFKELFGGGTASLSLSEPEDILNSGIDIIVHPPGKIVVHLDALSGGEKALVAIALYFAIMKVRPAPFCVMDEIEAALDDVNVDRFANYMRNLTHTTQFICITHRRGTMEEADVLYGVTMQDEGVSKLLELRSTEIAEKLGIKAN